MSTSIYQRSKNFIRNSKKVHRGKYDYNKVDYVNAKTNVIINCPIHGDFKQTPEKHFNRKHGCPGCGGTSKSSTHEFIFKAKQIHGDTYEYMLINYKGNREKVQIVCHKHGVFKQTPKDHLDGCGCPKCGGHAPLTQTDFVIRSIRTHNNRYDYSLAKYITDKIKVTIICPIHGCFEQTPNAHMKGQGCPICNSFVGYTLKTFETNEQLKSLTGRLYLLKFTETVEKIQFLKVGITKRSIKSRFSSGYENYKYEILVDKELKLYDAFLLEQHILNAFKNTKFEPKLPFDGRTECFTIQHTHQIVKTILTG